jgi:hypothetical protein
MKSIYKSKLLSLLLSLALVLSLFSGLGIAAGAEPVVAVPIAAQMDTVSLDGKLMLADEAEDIQARIEAESAAHAQAQALMAAEAVTIPIGTHITVGGTYDLDSTATRGTIYIDTSEAVTLRGSWSGAAGTANNYVSIDATGAKSGADLTLQNLWIHQPYNYGRVLDFVGPNNVLRSLGTNILESDDEYNYANVHVGAAYGTTPTTELTIYGTPVTDATGGLYIFKNSEAAAIGGDPYEECGVITFAGGKTYVKGLGVGAVIGGDARDKNGDITISGGQLSVVAGARGAGIGSSNQGACAGDVYITGGSTLINVDLSGSAIGYGASGSQGGDLYMLGGSLKVMVDRNAATYWGTTPNTDTISNIAITANIHYDSQQPYVAADVAEVDIGSLQVTGNLMVTAAPTDGKAAVLYDDVGLNQTEYIAGTPAYTPSNWVTDSSVNKLYVYLPVTPTTGGLVVSDGTSAGVTGSAYAYNPAPPNKSTAFDISGSVGLATVNLNGGRDYTTYVSGIALTSITVPSGSSFDFFAQPATGDTVTGAAVSGGGTVADNGGANYTLTGAVNGSTVTVETDSGVSYGVTFAGTHANAYLNGARVTQASVGSGDSLTFTVGTDDSYFLGAVTPSNGSVATNPDGSYTLSGLTGDSVVTITTTQVVRTVTFSGTGATGVVRGFASASAQVGNGGTLIFRVKPYLGYTAGTVTASAGTLSGPDAQGNYTLSNITANSTVTISTSADNGSWFGSDASGAYADTSWHTGASPYTIADAADLAGLAVLVNGGTTFANEVVTLTGNIDLSAHTWVPVGGGRLYADSKPVSTAPYFAGIFDGAGNTVSGIDIASAADTRGLGAFGLFGYVRGGDVVNLTVAGEIEFIGEEDSPGGVNAIGGAVGYTTGSVYNVTNAVHLDVFGINSSEMGGVVGVVSNGGGAASYVQYCANTIMIEGRSRLGGVVGAAYCVTQDGVIIDQSYNTGTVIAHLSYGNSYVGGVVGYCAGYIRHCYNAEVVEIGASGYINAGGIVGILSGSGATGPYGRLSDSFNTGLLRFKTANPDAVLEPLWADNDGSANVVVTDVVYLDSSVLNPDGTNKTQDEMGAAVTDIAPQTAQQMGDTTALPVYLSGDYYDPGDPNPTLKWQNPAVGAVGPVYVDVARSQNGDGSAGNPYNNMADALNAQSRFRSTIYVLSPVTYTGVSTEIISLAGDSGRIVRAFDGASETGALFTVNMNASLTVSAGIIEGQSSEQTRASGPLFSLADNGNLTIGSATLRGNKSTTAGGAINAGGGTLSVLSGALITGNQSSQNGGAISVSGGTASIAGQLINNKAASGGGLAVSGGAVTMTNGAISDNYIGTTYGFNGGGVYSSGGTFEMSNGEISGNTAGYGGGVYVDVNGSVELSGGYVSDNLAANGSGGGAYVNGSTSSTGPGGSLIISGGHIDGNTANTIGGGIYMTNSNATTLMTEGSVNGNISGVTGGGSGAGLYMSYGPAFTMSGGSISQNRSPFQGGGVFCNASTFIMSGTSQLTTNATFGTTGDGGAMFVLGSSHLEFNGGTVSGNTSATGYRGIYCNTSSTTVASTPVTGSPLNVTDTLRLPSGVIISVGALLTPVTVITIQCASPYSGLVIAQRTTGTFNPPDVNKFAYDGSYTFALSSDRTQIVLV